MFADLELIGIPHRITIGDRGLKQGQVEYQSRREGKQQMVDASSVLDFAKGLFA
jgi:prolyl-tRNA synthetase